MCFFFSSRRRHTRWPRDWSSDVCSSDLDDERVDLLNRMFQPVNELLGQGASAIDSRLATFKADVKKIDNKYIVEAELPEIGRASCRERVKIWVVAVVV